MMDEEEKKILSQIKTMDYSYLYYTDEEYFKKLCRRGMLIPAQVEIFRSVASQLPPMEPIEKRNLGSVKYYGPSELEEITEGFSEKNFVTDSMFGRLFRGKVHEGSESREVLVKTWEFYFPFQTAYVSHPARFSDEIGWLMSEESKANENFVKLVGYCFEKKLAVVYDIKLKGILSSELNNVAFNWTSRIDVAYKLACILHSLHEKFIILGAIDTSSVLLDEKYNMALFEFDLLAKLEEGKCSMSTSTVDLKACYRWFCPDGNADVWYMKSDVYAFGIFLLELIKGNKVARYMWDEIWFDFQKKEISLVNSELNQDADTCIAVSRLAVSCIALNPDDRPDMGYVVDALKTLVEDPGTKRQRTL